VNFETGTLILNGRYKLLRVLGSGAFAHVYEALHTHLNITRAIKILRPDAPGLGTSVFDEYEERFQLEAEVGAQLNHPTPNPNLVQVYDFDREQGELFLIMEFCAKESCGKCPPCRIGTSRMLAILERICGGTGAIEDIASLEELALQVKKNSFKAITVSTLPAGEQLFFLYPKPARLM